MAKPHFHQCPRPSCRHIWQHSEPSKGWRSPEQFDQYHTCPECKQGSETFKCDATGFQPELPGLIIAYEQGELRGDDAVIELFQRLVNSGLAWQLQGHYGRTARELIRAGLITEHQ